MKVEQISPYGYYIHELEWFSLDKTLGCGQCFRWYKDSLGNWLGVVRSKGARMMNFEEGVILACYPEDLDFWIDYFDLHTDYLEINRNFMIDEYSAKCVEESNGLRVLRQDKYEALVHYIISQNNSISNISKSIQKFCSIYGDLVHKPELNMQFYDLPTPEKVCTMGFQGLYQCSMGYRAEYLESLFKFLVKYPGWLDEIDKLNTHELLKELQTLKGVGPKVANCEALFAYNRTECFPIDVWIRRMIARHYGGISPQQRLGKYAGIFQEYLYFVGK